MSEWQPIETAPKDGTFVLLAVAGVSGEWAVGQWGAHSREGEGEGAWYLSQNEHGRMLWGTHSFTHWMPLPSLPALPPGESDYPDFAKQG